MTTTEKLREALQAVEPEWVVPNADTLRKRARRIRLRRRIAGGVALAMVVTAGVAAKPHLLPDAGSTTAAFGQDRTVPTTISEATAITQLEIRQGGLPFVRRSGQIVTVAMTQEQYQLRSPVSAWYAVGDVCAVGGSCLHLERRDPGGWVAVTETRLSTATDELIGPSQLVVETPVAGVVATIDGTRIPAELTNLGQGYSMVSLSTAAMTSVGGELAARPVKVWAFSPRGELVARYPQ